MRATTLRVTRVTALRGVTVTLHLIPSRLRSARWLVQPSFDQCDFLLQERVDELAQGRAALIARLDGALPATTTAFPLRLDPIAILTYGFIMAYRIRTNREGGYPPKPLYGQHGRQVYDVAGEQRITGYLFSAGHAVDRAPPHALVIPPQRLARGRTHYLLERAVCIDLHGIEPDLYQVRFVQDFWAEDANPDLDVRLGGIFFGRRRISGEWEVPESWPIECRSLAMLGTVDTRPDRYAVSLSHGG